MKHRTPSAARTSARSPGPSGRRGCIYATAITTVPAGRTLRQEAAGYRADPAWLAKKYEALNDAHKKMIVELTLALLRLEGKR